MELNRCKKRKRTLMEEDDDLDVYNSVANGDWIVSYIDQDWT